MKTAKALAAAVSAIATVCTAAFADDILQVDETGTIISVVIVQAIGVYSIWKVRNKGYVDTGK